MINKNGSFFHLPDDAVVSETDFFKIFWEAEHEKKDINILSDFFRFRPFGAEFDERISFGFGSVKNLKLISSAEEMFAHTETHDSGSDPSDDFFCTLHDIKCVIWEKLHNKLCKLAYQI